MQQKFIKSNSEHFDKETLARARDEAVLRNIVYVVNIASLLKCTENINSNKVMIRVKVKVQGPQFLWISVTIHFKKMSTALIFLSFMHLGHKIGLQTANPGILKFRKM